MNHQQGRDFLFLQHKEREIKILLTGYVPLQVILKDYGIKLEIGQTWKLRLTGDKKLDLIPVSIITQPEGATIYIDGNNKGTVRTVQVAAGRHELRLEKQGHKTITENIDVSVQNIYFSYTLSQIDNAIVKINSIPDGASIIINGAEKGVTNRPVLLFPGKYRLKIAKSGYLEEQKEIEVTEGDANSFTFNLEENSGTLQLSIAPSDAKVLINRDDYSNRSTIKLAPEKYKIEISKAGYKDWTEVIEIELGKTLTKSYSLEARKGNLQFLVQPMGARVKLLQSGNTIQTWDGPKILKGLQAGDYTLEAEFTGYSKVSKKLTRAIIKQQTLSYNLRISLEQLNQAICHLFFLL